MRLHPLLLALAVATPARGQEAAAPTLLERFDLEHRLDRFDLPGRLEEISGLAFGPSGTLYAHGDERGVVFGIDVTTGVVGRGFTLGPTTLRDDFEGFAVAGERFFLISSTGHLYEFREAPQGGSSPVRITDTGLGSRCEVEGLAYDPASESLLAACKITMPAADEVRIERLPLDPAAPVPPPLRVPMEALAAVGLEGSLHPSGLDMDPDTGTLILVAAREEAVVALDREGRVLGAHRFSGKRHPQAEGIALGPDGRLYVGDEANGRKARLTVYGPPSGAPGS